MRAADGLDADLGEADVAHVALLDEVGDRADRVLDRHVRVEARGAVDVDDVDAAGASGCRRRSSSRRRAGVSTPSHAPSGARSAPNFTESCTLSRRPSMARPIEQLVVAHAVEVAGVEQGDAALDGGVDGGDALVVVGLPVHAGHAHAAERDGEGRGGRGGRGRVWSGSWGQPTAPNRIKPVNRIDVTHER